MNLYTSYNASFYTIFLRHYFKTRTHITNTGSQKPIFFYYYITHFYDLFNKHHTRLLHYYEQISKLSF